MLVRTVGSKTAEGPTTTSTPNRLGWCRATPYHPGVHAPPHESTQACKASQFRNHQVLSDPEQSKATIMNSSIIISVLAAVLILGSCGGSRTTDYPDQNRSAVRNVDDIKRIAAHQKAAIDREYAQVSNNMDFRERQIRLNYMASRESLTIHSDTMASELSAKRRDIDLEAKHEKEMIDADLNQKLVTGSTENAAVLQAEANNKKAEIDKSMTSKLAQISEDIERNDTDTRKKSIALIMETAKEVTDLEEERAQAIAKMRTRKLEVDRWTTDEMAKVDKAAESPKR